MGSTIQTPDGEALGVLPNPLSFSPITFPKMRKSTFLCSPVEGNDSVEAVSSLGKENEVIFYVGTKMA